MNFLVDDIDVNGNAEFHMKVGPGNEGSNFPGLPGSPGHCFVLLAQALAFCRLASAVPHYL
jgi:hypothetical protein